MKSSNKIFGPAWLVFCLFSYVQAGVVQTYAVSSSIEAIERRSFTNEDGRNCTYVADDPSWGYKCDDYYDLVNTQSWTLDDDDDDDNDEDAGLFVRSSPANVTIDPSDEQSAISRETQMLILAYVATAAGVIVIPASILNPIYLVKKYEPIFEPFHDGSHATKNCVSNYEDEYVFTGGNGNDHQGHFCLGKFYDDLAFKKYCDYSFEKSEADKAIKQFVKYYKKKMKRPGVYCLEVGLTAVKDGKIQDKDSMYIRAKFFVTDVGAKTKPPCDINCGGYTKIYEDHDELARRMAIEDGSK